MKFSYLAVFPPGNAVTGKTVRGVRGGYAIPARVLLRSRRLSSNKSDDVIGMADAEQLVLPAVGDVAVIAGFVDLVAHEHHHAGSAAV